jgi:hypothetical protein
MKLSDRTELPPLVAKADRAMKEAVAAAIAEHWRAGRPVYVWRDEQVVALYSDGTTVPYSQEREADADRLSPGDAPSKDR